MMRPSFGGSTGSPARIPSVWLALLSTVVWTFAACGSDGDGPTGVDGEGGAPGVGWDLLAVGSYHTCGIADETLYCWGDDGSGQLGDGTEDDATEPTPVVGDRDFGAVAAGSFHTCASTTSGNAYCWGENGSGQLGDGSTLPHAQPDAVTDGLGIEQIAAGGAHSCGIRSAGEAYCWGDNFAGQLGDGSTEPTRTTPVAVTGDLLFSSISAGLGSETCALAVEGGAYCWGALAGTNDQSTEPIAVDDDPGFTLISVGDGSVCGVDGEGRAYCWGDNGAGQLGDGSNDPSDRPVPVSGDLEFTDLDAGARHACGVATDEEIYCWGDNSDGQLGVGQQGGSSTTPIAVSSDARFSAVAAGDGHTCALDVDGSAYCWGRNSDGQLGDGTMQLRLEPTEVVDPD